MCLQLRDTQNAEYLGEIYLDVTLTPQSREEREQVIVINIQHNYNQIETIAIDYLSTICLCINVDKKNTSNI